jgi:hypothetical protein
MENQAELVSLQVLVPRDRIAEFYEMHSRWLRGEADQTPQHRLIALHEGDEPRTWTEGYQGELVADALIVYDKLSKGAKRILDALIEMPGAEVSGDQLASLVDLGGDQLTGTLASLGVRSKGVNRQMPIRYTRGPHGGTYVVEPEVGSLFRRVKAMPQDTGPGSMPPMDLANSLEVARQELKELRAWYESTRELPDNDPQRISYRDLCGALEFEVALLANLILEAFDRSTQEHEQKEVPMPAPN